MHRLVRSMRSDIPRVAPTAQNRVTTGESAGSAEISAPVAQVYDFLNQRRAGGESIPNHVNNRAFAHVWCFRARGTAVRLAGIDERSHMQNPSFRWYRCGCRRHVCGLCFFPFRSTALNRSSITSSATLPLDRIGIHGVKAPAQPLLLEVGLNKQSVCIADDHLPRPA